MTNNKQQTAVDSIIKFMKNNQYFIGNDLYEFLQQAKEMEQSQAQLYATFCFMCANKNIPIIEFKDWIDLTYGGNK